MSVVVLAEGLPSLDLLDEAEAAARALEVDLVVLQTAPGPAIAVAKRTLHVKDLEPFSADASLAAFTAILPDLAPTLVVAADSAHTRAFFPALAARLGQPLLSAATRVRVLRRDRLEIERPLHAALQSERLVVAPPLFVTVLGAGSAARPPGEAPAVSAESVAPAKPAALRDTVTRVIAPDAETVDIRQADRIVAGGLGLGSQENVALLGRLAKPLHAAVGGTRVISDRGWLEHERYIGSTGKTVAPKLYVALGISGASQHLVGITDSEAIIAINTDRAAPIFGVADLGIVGDLHAIVPELEKRLAKSVTSEEKK